MKWLGSERPDVLCLQETKCIDDRFPREAVAELGYESLIFGQPTYNGVAILARAGSTDGSTDLLADVQRGFPKDSPEAQARLLVANVRGVHIINVYIPNGQAVGTDKYQFKLEWMRRLRDFIDSRFKPDEKVFICGDFNVAPEEIDVHDPKLWRGRILFSKPEREALDHIKQWGFVDTFRLHNQEGGQFSWWDYRAASFRRNAGLRIDHVWASEPLARLSTNSWIDKEPRQWERPSDHTPVVAEFKRVK